MNATKTTLAVLWLLMTPVLLAGKADEVLDKSAKVLGGEIAAKEITSLILNGQATMPQGLTADLQVLMKDGGKLYTKMEIVGQGMSMVAEQGCDGTECYEKNPMMGTRKLEGQEKENLLLQNDFKAILNWRDHYKEVAYLKEENVGDRATHKIKIVTNAGMEMVQYIDKETYLILKTEALMTSAMGQMNVISTFHQYKDIHKGFQIPMETNVSVMGQQMNLVIKETEINAKIPDSKFQLPSELTAAATE